MMWGTWGGWGAWAAIAGVGFIVFLTLAIAGVVLLLQSPGGARPSDTARQILDDRLARGEIDEQEHERRRAVLQGGHLPRPRRFGVAMLVVGTIGILAMLALGITGLGVAGGRVIAWTRSGAMGGMGGMGGIGGMGGMHDSMHGTVPDGGVVPSPRPGAKEIRLVARDFSFKPAEIEIRTGKTTNLTLANHGRLLHDITIPALRFRLVVPAGSEGSGAVTATKRGRYDFNCSVPGHREAGMKGVLVVT